MQAVIAWLWAALKGVSLESWHLLLEMAPYLIIGFIFAGILHVFFSVRQIAKHLGKSSFGSVLKATLFGIPLPLCSCSVIPAISTLRKNGASRGAALAFLISTPTSGADSILATYSLLGPIFTIYRILASFFAGLISGLGANILDTSSDAVKENAKNKNCVVCGNEDDGHSHSFAERMKTMIAYSFGELMADIGKWVLIGTVIGGAISYFLPAELIGAYLSSPILQMLLMLVLSMPLYICATGSLPIAAALILKGISPGAALVFLIAGPATNAITVTVVSKTLGRKSLIIYLVSIIMVSLGMGFLFNLIIPWDAAAVSGGKMLGTLEFPKIIKVISSAVILVLIAFQIGKSILSGKHHHHHHDEGDESHADEFHSKESHNSCGCGSSACSTSHKD